MGTNTYKLTDRGNSFLSSFFSFGWLRRTKDTDGTGYWISQNGAYSYELQDLKKLVAASYCGNPHAFSVINKILLEVLNVPWYVYEVKNAEKFKEYKAHKNMGNWDQVLKIEKEALVRNQKKTDLQKLVDQPNPKQSFEQYIQACLAGYLLTGDVISYIIPSNLSSRKGILQLIPLPPQFTKVIPKKGWDGKVDRYELFLDPSSPITFQPQEILQISNYNPGIEVYSDSRGLNYSLPVRGLSIFASLGTVIQGSNDGFIAQMKLLQNGGPLGILSNKSNMPMSGMQVDSTKRALAGSNEMDDYIGPWNRGKIRMTTANMSWIPMGMNSVDLQILDLQKASLATVCNVANMPLEMMSMEGATFNNKKEALKEMWNGAILPHMNPIRDGINTAAAEFYPEIKNGDSFIDYDHHSVPALQQDIEKMHKIGMEQVQNALITRRMYQERMGIENAFDDGDLDKYMTNTSLRFADEPLPGRTDVNNSNNGTD